MSRTVVVAHPSADVYGSDRQLLETVAGLVAAGVRTVAVVPGDGPLIDELRARGAEVRSIDFPVLRKSALRPAAFLRLVGSSLAALPRLVRVLRSSNADALLVNTITVPWWLLAGRLCRITTVGHVHEAEEDRSRAVRTLLALPNVLAHRLVVNSRASQDALVDGLPALRRRTVIVHNGVPGPGADPEPPRPRAANDPLVLVTVARLSPRKGIDVALEAAAILVAEGRDVRLHLCGTPFEGYEWFEADLRERAAQADLAGRVEFHGYVNPTWPLLADSDVVLVPSRVEPFGNTAVEALLARRPLVASATQGLCEIVQPERNGLLATAGDAADLARQVGRLADEPHLARRLADDGRADALDRFGLERYRAALRQALGVPS